MFTRHYTATAAFVAGALVFAWSGPPTAADSLGAGDGRVFRLNPTTTYQHGCFPPCLCPILEQRGVAGTFTVAFVGTVGGNESYEVRHVNWWVPRTDGPLRVTGSGKYQRGSPLLADVVQHRMELNLKVGEKDVQHFDSGWITLKDPTGIDITVSVNGMYCLDTVFGIDSDPVPADQIEPYELRPGSTFQRGCFDPCDCPLGPELPLSGGFDLVPLHAAPFVSDFSVVNIRWRVADTAVVDGFSVTGVGQYQRGQDSNVARQRMMLDLSVDGGDSARFDSRWVPSPVPFPLIDVLVSMNDQVCFDTVLHVVAAPVDAEVCGGFAGIPCEDPAEFCKLPVGHCCCDFTGVCTTRPTGCPTVWDPVCGCDNETYGNECEADVAGVSIAHRGACDTVCRPSADGSTCEPLACSAIPEDRCLADALHLDVHTGAITVRECRCRDMNECHVEFGDATPFPVGNCPDGGECRVVGTDTDNDGIEDLFTAECVPAIGECCLDIDDGPVAFDTCEARDQRSCEADGGVFHDVNAPCTEVQACCFTKLGASFCAELAPSCCRASGGVPQGRGSVCSDANTCPRMCGGWAGDTCRDDEFCKFPLGVCSDIVDDSGVCTPIPDACPQVLDPVCGCDGKTYPNECEADRAGVSILHHGACGVPCTDDADCPALSQFCMFREGTCGDATVGGVCTEVPTGCPRVFDPVCGCDGETYSNECEAKRARQSVAHRGECDRQICTGGPNEPPCPSGTFCLFPVGTCGPTAGVAGVCTPIPEGCPEHFDPVCGCDGNTYSNECEAHAAAVSIRFHGPCDSRECGRTDPNLACGPDEFCKFPPGTCEDSSIPGLCTPIPNSCPEFADPVCGCDGVTYDNECFADRAGVSIDHSGLCEQPPCAARRVLSTPTPSYCPGVAKRVRISLAPPSGTSAIGLEDVPPENWVVTEISHDGEFDAINGKVKWGPLFAPFPSEVGYVVVPGDELSALPACFSGTVSVDGRNQAVCGEECVFPSCAPLIAADLPQEACAACPAGCGRCTDGLCGDGRVSMCEAIGYACAWRNGCNDDLAGMTRAAFLWRTSECYCWSDPEANWFPAPCPPPALGLCPADLGAADEVAGGDEGTESDAARPTRPTLRKPRTRGERIFSARLDPPDGTVAIGVEVNVPAGWEVAEISGRGVWDAANGKVKWGPYFDDAPGSVELTVRRSREGDAALERKVPRELRPLPITGTVSYDGVNNTVTFE